jgi:acetylornithine deacetylase
MGDGADRTDLTASAVAHLARLVAFDTTSRNSNLPLIGHVEALLAPLGARLERVPDATGTKANLMAGFGPLDQPGGVILSGHTDVVPVDGQPWSTDPWTLTERDGRLYGRGTCDMKGFSAAILALAPKLAAAPLRRPVHIALSYDEEVGCVGAPDMVTRIAATLPGIEAVIIGEPTDMKVVSGHKGIASWTVEVTGREAHSSQIGQGVSAIAHAVELMGFVLQVAEDLRGEAPAASLFEPPGATMTIGLMQGGTAVNILARTASFTFDLRCEAGQDPLAIVARIEQAVARTDAAIRARAPEGGARMVRRSFTPALAPRPDSSAERLARQLTGDNGVEVVAYGTEGGLFQQAGFATIVCGPGSILQAHQPDEFVEISQIAACTRFLDRLIDRQCQP